MKTNECPDDGGELVPMADDDPRAIEGAVYQVNGAFMRVVRHADGWYFEDV